MRHLRACLLATIAVSTAFPATAEAQLFGRSRNQTVHISDIKDVPRCTQQFGTITIAETQDTLFQHMDLTRPSDLLRVIIRDSGCFQLIERGAGMGVVERERSLGAGGRIRTADFVLVAEIDNNIDADSSDRRSGMLGMIGQAGGRLLLQSAASATTGGTSTALSLVSRGVGMMRENNASDSPQAALNERTIKAIRGLRKDIDKGKEDAQIVMTLTSVPLVETAGYTRALANQNELRRLRIRDNQFDGRVGDAYEKDNVGKVVALSMVRAYAELVESLGGTGSDTPDIVIANREAVSAADQERQRAAQQIIDTERREEERRDRLRREEEERIRYEIRREIEAEQARLALVARTEAVLAQLAEATARMAEEAAAAAQIQAPVTGGRYEIDRTTVLRSSPAGDVIVSIAAGAEVIALEEENEDWIQVRTAHGDGWVLKDRLIDLN